MGRSSWAWGRKRRTLVAVADGVGVGVALGGVGVLVCGVGLPGVPVDGVTRGSGVALGRGVGDGSRRTRGR